VTFVLTLIIAVLLAVIGLLYHLMIGMGDLFGGFLSGLTQNMGPGVTHENKKDFPVHAVFYVLSVVAVVVAFYLRAK
jgi:hypothetical protein